MHLRPAALVIERHAAIPSSDAGAARGHTAQAVERLLATRCWRAVFAGHRKAQRGDCVSSHDRALDEQRSLATPRAFAVLRC
jgi:hypothetical protein